MARIAGLKLIKSASGKITHVTLSMKHYSGILQDMVDLADINNARKNDTVDWSEAKEKINKKHKLKS